MLGKIIKQISNDYTVLINGELLVCKSRGKFRKLGITPLVGDNVKVDVENNGYLFNLNGEVTLFDGFKTIYEETSITEEVEDVEKSMKGMLEPEYEEKVLVKRGN